MSRKSDIIDTTKTEKNPVHSVVAVICDILTPLTNEERVRAMDAIATSLGIDYQSARPAAQLTASVDNIPFEPAPPRRPTSNARGGTFRGGGGSSVTVFPVRLVPASRR